MRLLLVCCLCLAFSPSVLANNWVHIPEGRFLMGSTTQQVQQAYEISRQAYGHDGVRQAHWFDTELPQRIAYTKAYRIMKTPVTQEEYAIFVKATGHRVPFVSPKQWQTYHLVHSYRDVRPYLWLKQQYPHSKAKHPVVLVDVSDAQAYAHWLSIRTGRLLQLPTEKQWEKAMRGNRGFLYPWGNAYDAHRLNNADRSSGSIGTMPVASFPNGASPYGVLDAAGQVYEWIHHTEGHDAMVKGGSWDDHGGVCRPAAHHFRPIKLKHILIGFRLVDMGSLP